VAPRDHDAIYASARQVAEEEGLGELVWGITPYMGTELLLELYSPLIESVSQKTGLSVLIQVGEDYADMERRLVGGDVDVAVISPYSYVRAKRSQPGIEVFASHIAAGSVSYGAYIITREDSGIESLEDLRGKRFAFVDQRSTSGWLFPAARMLSAGIHPTEDLEEHFLNTHDQVFDAVMSGSFAGGATYAGAIAEGRQRHPDTAVMLRVVAKAQRIPHEAYAGRAGLPEAVGRALATALSEISTADSDGRRLLAPMARARLDLNGFLEVEDSHYDVIREVESELESLGLRFAP
jgi:phosphate/phosphite/phosphonate ABC transporter binding protein